MRRGYCHPSPHLKPEPTSHLHCRRATEREGGRGRQGKEKGKGKETKRYEEREKGWRKEEIW